MLVCAGRDRIAVAEAHEPSVLLEKPCQLLVVDLDRLGAELRFELCGFPLALAERAADARSIELRAALLEAEQRHQLARPQLRRQRHAGIEWVGSVEPTVELAPQIGKAFLARGLAFGPVEAVARGRRVDNSPAPDSRPGAEHHTVAC